jgi:hypothetical protein
LWIAFQQVRCCDFVCLQEMDYFRKVGIVTDEKKAAANPVATN